jgi:DNA-binding GntR family transcriptional regulator
LPELLPVAEELSRGLFVRTLTSRDLQEMYELRIALEVHAFRVLAARGEAPEEAKAAIEQLRGLNSRSPRRLVVEADLAFHRAIVSGAGNARLSRAHDELTSEILLSLAQLAEGYASVRELIAMHGELLEAIEGVDLRKPRRRSATTSSAPPRG